MDVEKTAKPRSRRPRRWTFVAAMVAGSLVASLVVLEIAVRCLSDEGESLLVKDELVGQRYRANFSGARYIPEAAARVHLRFNGEGFRGPDRAHELTPGVARIAVLGDSFTAAVGVDESATMTARLEAELNGAVANRPTRGVAYETMNFGVSGFGTAQALLVWRHFAKPYRPDLVVLCFYNGNDLADNCEKLSTANRPFFELDEAGQLVPRPMSAARTSLSRGLAGYSQLYVWQRHKMKVLRDRWRQSTGYLPPGLQILNPSPPPAFADAWKLTEALLADLNDDVRNAGAKLLVASIPCHEQVRTASWEKFQKTFGAETTFDRDLPETKLGDICRRRGIEFFALRSAIARACETEELFFANEGHWNERGNAVAARALAERLAPTLDRLAAKP